MFRSLRRSLPLVLCFAPAVVTSACQSADAEAGTASAAEMAVVAAAPQEVLVRTRDFAFDAPDTIQSGATRFRLINDGPEFHHIQLVRLLDGKTLDDLGRFMSSGSHSLPEWAVAVGGPNTPGIPGEETNATLDLEPGEYAMLCVIPSPDGQPHTMKGMVKPLTVVPAAARAAVPEADLVLMLDDYSFAESTEILAGVRTIRVENRAEQPHEVVFAKLEPGKNAGDFLKFMTKPEGTPPGKLIGGTSAIAKGEINQVTLELEPGDYAMLCFIPDHKDGQPHIAHGMIRQITVR